MSSLTTQFRHAITPPSFERGKLHRERLVDLLHGHIPNRLIAVVAPAGYGKSTLLADFIAHTDLPVCWLRLSRADRDSMRLATLLSASLQKRFRRLKGEPDLEALSGSPPEALARALIESIESRVPEPFVLALDDVQLINPSPPAMTLIDTFLAEMPDRVTLLVAGRELPEVSMARLVLDGEMAGIGAHDLALSREELTAVVQEAVEGSPPEEEIDRLLRETEGWPAGVWLSSTLLRDRAQAPRATYRPMVYEYLASEVFADLPKDLRAFALEASVLPVMSAEMCDRVLERGESRQLLSDLYHLGVFLTATDDEPRTYEFHPQFRKFLLDTLTKTDTESIFHLRTRAASILEEEHAVEEAVELYFEAGQVQTAAQLIDRHAPELFEAGRIETLTNWQERLRRDRLPSVTISLYLATAYTDRGKLEDAENELEFAFSEALKVTSPEAKEQLARAETVSALVALHRGEYDQVLEAAQRAEALLSETGQALRRATCLRLRALAIYRSHGDLTQAIEMQEKAVDLIEKTNDKYTLAAFLLDLYTMHYAVGEKTHAQNTILRAKQILDEIRPPQLLALCNNNLAVYAHRSGNYEEALTLFNEGVRYAHQAATLRLEANIIYGQADLFNDLGLVYQAAELYGRGLRMSNTIRNHSLVRYGCMQTSAAHRRAGSEEVAAEWLERAYEVINDTQPPASLEIQRAALEIARTPQNVMQILMDLLREPDSSMHASERVQLLYFLAKSALAMNRKDDAEGYLQQALDQAGKSSSEQYIAGEMLHDAEMIALATDRLLDHPTLAIILERIEIMRLLARRYQRHAEEPQRTGALLVRALGASHIRFDGKPLTEIEPLPRQLFFFLIDSQPVQRDLILEALWPDIPEGRQVSSLYTAMHALRAALKHDLIQIEGPLYSLDPKIEFQFDVGDFEDSADLVESLPPGDPRRFFALTEAVGGYGGAFLPEFTSDWVIERRRLLEKRYLELLSDHAQEALTRGHTLEAYESLGKALEIDPLRDDLNKRYLEVLGLLGRRSDIVAHYRRYIQVLESELGLPPSPDVRDLYDSLIQ